MRENFEIINGLPPYGEMYVSIPRNNPSEYSEGLVIKFEKKDKTFWIGNFATGNSNLKFASKLNDGENILIIAKGICYIINPENTDPIIEFGYDIKKVFKQNNLFFLIGEYSVSIVENHEKIIYYSDLCDSGIKNSRLFDGKIHGDLYNIDSSGDNYVITEFEINVKTLEFREFKKTNRNEKWWEFWK